MTDEITAPGTNGQLSDVSCADPTLPPGATTTCSANYTVSQADLNSATGELMATATAHAVDPSNTDVASDSSPYSISTVVNAGAERRQERGPDDGHRRR